MAERTIVVRAAELGRERFTASDCQQSKGRPFPVTDMRGVEIAEGWVLNAELVDKDGTVIAVRVRVPDGPLVAAKPLESDVGKVMRR